MLYAVIREWDRSGNGYVRAIASTPQEAFDCLCYYVQLANMGPHPSKLGDWSIWEWDMLDGMGECWYTHSCDSPPIVHALDEWMVLAAF